MLGRKRKVRKQKERRSKFLLSVRSSLRKKVTCGQGQDEGGAVRQEEVRGEVPDKGSSEKSNVQGSIKEHAWMPEGHREPV